MHADCVPHASEAAIGRPLVLRPHGARKLEPQFARIMRRLSPRRRLAARRVRGAPFAPMRRPDVEPFLGLGFHPAVEDAAAWKHERMRTVFVDHGQLKVAVKRRFGYVLPHFLKSWS